MTKNKSRQIVLLIIGLFWVGLAQAQESVNATGGDASGSGGTVAYSVGQVVYTTNNSTSGTVSQGVQQPYEIFTVGIKETELNTSLSVFPNPTADNLTLQVNDFELSTLNFQLFNMQGKLLTNGIVTSNQTHIDMSELPAATYFLKIVQGNNQVQSFKIIKN